MLDEVTREVEGVERTVNVGSSLWLTVLSSARSAPGTSSAETSEILVECNEEIDEDKSTSSIRVFTSSRCSTSTTSSSVLPLGTPWSTRSSTRRGRRGDYRLRPGDAPTYDAALNHFENLFFDERYDLSRVGRLKINHKLGIDEPLEQTTLTREDIRLVVQYLIDLKNNKGEVDDIDHLGNSAYAPLASFSRTNRVGLVRMEKAIKERMS